MSLDHRQIALVRESFRGIDQTPTPVHRQFYETLFRHDPKLRALFRADIESQGMSFMRTLRTILDNLERPETLGERYGELGVGHQAVGVHRRDFDVMEDALMETLANALGEAWDDEVEAAWRAAYREIAARMIAAGGIG